MNLKERNVPSAKIYIPSENLEERKKVRKFAAEIRTNFYDADCIKYRRQ